MPAIVSNVYSGRSIGARYFTTTSQTKVLTNVPNGAVVGYVSIDGIQLAQSDWNYVVATKTLTLTQTITGTAWGYCQFTL